MKFIFGEHFSGKSFEVIKMVNNDPSTIYFVLDGDKSIDMLLGSSQIKKIKNCFLLDIESEIYGRDVKRIVIDPINCIKTVNDSNVELSFKSIIKGLEYLHYTYDIEVVAIYNTLKMIDRTRQMVDLNLLKSWKIVEIKKEKRKTSKINCDY